MADQLGMPVGSMFLLAQDRKINNNKFCAACYALKSTHIGDDKVCPTNPHGRFEAGGEYIYWLRTGGEPRFADEPAAVSTRLQNHEIAKLLKASGERVTYVEMKKPEITLTYEETKFLLGLLNKESLLLDKVKEDPELFRGLTPDELGTLIAKLMSTP